MTAEDYEFKWDSSGSLKDYLKIHDNALSEDIQTATSFIQEAFEALHPILKVLYMQ